MAYDAPVSYPADESSRVSWLRNQSKDSNGLVTNINGATAIVTDAANPTRSAYILSNGHYYLLEADCSTTDQQADEYFSSFMPITK